MKPCTFILFFCHQKTNIFVTVESLYKFGTFLFSQFQTTVGGGGGGVENCFGQRLSEQEEKSLLCSKAESDMGSPLNKVLMMGVLRGSHHGPVPISTHI